MSIHEPIRRRHNKTDKTSRKSASFDYKIDDKPVCLKTVVNTFAVTPRRIQILQNKIKDGQIIPKDERGIHTNRPHAKDNNVRDLIRAHIDSFPKIPNHYSRNKSSKDYLSPDLSISRLHKLFVECNPESKVSLRLYREIFYKDFKLRFGTPRSDTCKTCDLNFRKLTSASSEEERKNIELDSMLHHAKADQAYTILKADSLSLSQVTLCVDLQQVLFTPMLTHSNVFYQRQYSSYNFCIHNMTNGEASMFIWHECIAKRGANEIASCLLKYIVSNFRPLQSGEERKLVVWSDRCVGQNNNWCNINTYMFLIRTKYFTEINQKFLVSGHSFLPCDRDFALIERQRKKAKAMVPSDWKYVIASAKLNKPFSIIELNQGDFKNMTSLCLGTKKGKLKITTAMWLKMTAEDPCSLYVRSSHNIMRPWEIFTPFPEKIDKSNYEDLPLLYTTLLPISKEKKADLLDMAKYLPNEENRQFYLNLPSV